MSRLEYSCRKEFPFECGFSLIQMTLSDTDEILPLINRSKTDHEVPNDDYHSLLNLNKHGSSNIKQSAVCKKNFQHDRKKCIDVKSTQTYTNPFRSKDPSDEKITYSWKKLNAYNVLRNNKNFSSWTGLARQQRSFSNQPKQILKNVYGIAYYGELLGIIGASGAGKTTLLNALTFHSGPNFTVNGMRCLNGVPVINRNTVAKVSAYVEQEIFFIGTLTVKEHLIFQSLVRTDRNVSYWEKLKRVENVITELGLEKCQHTMIGYEGRTKGISGGEKKRLCFASEILTNPPIMICDEPTSGLDSFMALNVINVLKSMAIKGKTVICTIHQPSSEIFSLFDKILIIAEGRTAFLGKPNEAISFFTELGASPPANYNPADFFIQLLAIVPNREEICKGNIKLICDSFDQSLQGLETVHKIDCEPQIQILNDNLNNCRRCNRTLEKEPEQFIYAATWFGQFRALFWRSWINILKEPLLIKVRLFQTLVLSLVVGLIYHEQKLNESGVMNINGVLFTFLTNMTFQNLFAVISVFCNELPVFVKEQSNKLYRVDTYFLSKTLAEIPMFLAIPVIFTCITYYWINLNPELYHFAFTILILILVTNVATSFGYFISCISTNVVMAMSIGPPVIIPFLLFGGFLLNVGTIPIYFKWLSYLSWFKYGNEALLVNQWSDIKSIECNTSATLCPRTGEIVLEIYHFQKENFWWDIGSLVILILLFRSLAFFALLLKVKRHNRC